MCSPCSQRHGPSFISLCLLVPFLLNRLSMWVIKVLKSFSLVLFIWNGHVLWKWATLQREEVLPLESIYMNLGEVARMVPLSSPACPIYGRPSSLGMGGKGQEGGGGEITMRRILEKFLQYFSPSKIVTPWWFSLLQLLVPQLEIMRGSHKSFKPLLKFTTNLGT